MAIMKLMYVNVMVEWEMMLGGIIIITAGTSPS